MQLTDIDWRQGTVTLKHTKSRRQDLLPLPTSTGRALEAYLRHERPKTSDPAVFVRRLAPHDEPVGVDAIPRIVRDAAYRGYSAKQTIDRWESVRRGEKSWIFPFQEHADVMFNSALVYELAVLKRLAEPLLLQVKPTSRAYIEAKRLLAFLEWFQPLVPDLVPDNSILSEFVGGSILRDLHAGKLRVLPLGRLSVLGWGRQAAWKARGVT